MENVTLTIEDNPNPTDIKSFWDILITHNSAQAGPSNFRKLYIMVRDNNGNVVGGLEGDTFWGWLFVQNLAISESHRGQGLGTQLLKTAEAEAISRGCHHAYLDTFSFQALPFYKKHGFELFGKLADFPVGHERYFLTKPLS